MGRHDPMPLGHSEELLRSERAEQVRGDIRKKAVVQPVQPLEMPEEQQQLFEMCEGEAVVEPMQRRGYGVRELFLREVGLQLVEILARALQLAMLRFGDSPHQ